MCQPTVLAPTASDGVACDSIGGLTTDGTTIAQNQAGAGTVAVGPKAVYWSVNTGNIMLVAK